MVRTTLSLLLVAASILCVSCQNAPDSRTASPLSPAAVSGALSRRLPEFPDDPNAFVSGLSNPYLAFETGKTFYYEGQTEDGLETTIVEVLDETKVILGVTTTVVHDQVFLDGELIEDTFDWYAQDIEGNVWYFGEDTKEFEDGEVVSTEGSWEAGVDGAEPGIAMLAEPRVGLAYYQEFYEGVAEDQARVLNLSAHVEVPYGEFDNAIKIMEWTQLSPGDREFKYYVAGIGLVLEVHPRGGMEREELVAIEE